MTKVQLLLARTVAARVIVTKPMTASLFLEWYKDDFIPNVKAFKQRENKTGKVLLLMDKAPSHPKVDVLNGVDKNFQDMFLPTNVTALIQSMDQRVINKMKCM